MVVDLGAAQHIVEISLDWTTGPIPSATITTSTDGRAYGTPVTVPNGQRIRLPVDLTGRYLALTVPSWRPGQAALISLSIRPGSPR
jgi:hypothetical protein